MSSYLVPVYDPNTIPARNEPTTVLQPLAYPQTAANPIYQNQVLYSPATEQYANANAQYPAVGYHPMSYAVNGVYLIEGLFISSIISI